MTTPLKTIFFQGLYSLKDTVWRPTMKIPIAIKHLLSEQIPWCEFCFHWRHRRLSFCYAGEFTFFRHRRCRFCRWDSSWCPQWWQVWHHDSSRFSMPVCDFITWGAVQKAEIWIGPSRVFIIMRCKNISQQITQWKYAYDVHNIHT